MRLVWFFLSVAGGMQTQNAKVSISFFSYGTILEENVME